MDPSSPSSSKNMNRKRSRLRNQNPGECAGRIVRRPSQKIPKLEDMQRVLRKRSFVKGLQHLNNLFHHSARMQKEALQHMNIDGWSLSILLKPLVTLLLITHGPEGTGKTFLYKAILATISVKGHIALARTEEEHVYTECRHNQHPNLQLLRSTLGIKTCNRVRKC